MIRRNRPASDAAPCAGVLKISKDTHMPIDEARFRQAMGYFASGVTVVTAAHDDQIYGVTVSSFSSLSLRPPLVLVCLDKTLRTHDAINESGHFVVNFLERRQEHLSRRFATRDDDKFSGIAWHNGQLGLPVLEGVLAVVECKLHAALPGGDHTIFVGEVAHAEVFEGSPLLYYRRGYHELK
jgi:flavin reductase (DIM6/NTAB) family NADH-FMN oxidoreductase RutF